AISARFNHPNIVTVYDVADQGSAAFIAMELVNGTNLEKYLADEGPLNPPEAMVVGAAVANALTTAHAHGLVHHDVKPANVLLGRDQSIKVTDFGISELISAATRADDVICGTPGYIAPECFLGEAYGPSADLFSLGLILYEALAGKNPFHGRTLRETILNTATVEPEPIELLRPEVPLELAELIVGLMAKEPGDRPADAATVATQLEEMVRKHGATWAPRVFSPLPPDAAEKAQGRTQLITVSELS
ncbi:MAG: serine/threonine-protein kinase, partial [Acidobacteriota bacterium]